MNFTAVRQNSEETIIATMSCTNDESLTQSVFLQKLRSALNRYTSENEEGKKALNYSGGDFNFGDLALHAENPALLNLLASEGITDFKMTVSSSRTTDFDFDIRLID